MSVGLIASGLVFGCLAGLNSIGFVLLWRTQRVVNLAQPALGLVGGTITGLLVVSAGWSFWTAAPVGIMVGACLAFGVHVLVFKRLSTAPRSALLMATVGVAAVLGGMASALPFIVGGPLPTYSLDLGIRLDLFPVRLLGPHLLALVLFPLALVGTMLFLRHTRVGLANLAVGQDIERARALGISPDRVQAWVWVLTGVLSTVAGILTIPIAGFSLGGGLAPVTLLLALSPAVFAGMRSLMVAGVAALCLGVAYRLMFLLASSAGAADLFLAASLIAAVALQRRRFGRIEAASRASSWDAATTPRPLPPDVASNLWVRLIRAGLLLIGCIVAIKLAFLLEPGDRVLFAGAAAITVAVISVAVAWMFTGEIALGNWGLAGFGAIVAAVLPWPWGWRCLAAAVGLGVVGALSAVATRRRWALGFPLIGLAIAGAAPVALLLVAREPVQTDPRAAGASAIVIALLSAASIAKLRNSRLGMRMVLARDEPQRAAALGSDPARMRVYGMVIASGLAGLSGALYLAAIPAGIAPGAFDPKLSLDVLAIAVVGGLGSSAGAVSGAVLVQGARYLLPGAWGEVISGLGVILVVTFFPSGLAGVIANTWNKLAYFLSRDASQLPGPNSSESADPRQVPV